MKYTLQDAPVDYERPTPIEDGLWAVFGNVVGLVLLAICLPALIGVLHWWPA